MDARPHASIPSGCEAWLRGEAESWTKEGLIRREQAEYILARYGLVEAETPGSLKQVPVIRLLTALGAILVGVGVLLMVGANWEAIPRLARLVLLLVVTGGTYAIGYRLAFVRRSYPTVGMGLLFLGSLFWGSSIFLVGQMYHTGGGGGSGGERDALFYWFVGVLPLAYILRSPLHLGLSIVLGTIWILWQWTDGINHDQIPSMLFLLVLSEGLLLYAMGLLHSLFRAVESLAAAYSRLGIAVVTGALYFLSFEFMWRERMYGEGFQAETLIWLAPALFLVAAAVTAGVVLAYRDRERSAHAVAVLGLAGVAALLLALQVYVGGTLDHATAITVIVAMNILLFGAEIGFVWLGWRHADVGLVNWGVTVFAIHLMTRYFDVLVRMLDQGVALAGAGLLLILGGMALERQRKRLMQTMPRPRPEAPPADAGTLSTSAS